MVPLDRDNGLKSYINTTSKHHEAEKNITYGSFILPTIFGVWKSDETFVLVFDLFFCNGH